jgi:hypothetical protein
MSDGVLRKVTDRTWVGRLAGWTVQVSSAGGWHCAIIHPKGWTRLCPRAASFAHAAAQVRAWIEANPLPAAVVEGCARPTGSRSASPGRLSGRPTS